MPRMQFGNYEIVKKIGAGGMAQVFLAERLGLEGFHRRVALKCILPQMTRDERFVQMFINEARLGSQLHHPNIIEIQDFNKVDDVYYIAMEFVEGVDLGEIIVRYRKLHQDFPPGLALDIMIQALEGLGYAHEATTEEGHPMNIIHRDIKPSNLLLTRRGTVKIADFGIARAATNAYQTRTADVTKGSLAYMSPEQITREVEPRPSSDLFALAAVLFEMLTLRALFDGDNVPSIMFKVAQVDIERDLSEVEARYPEVVPILRKALAREQHARYQLAGEFADALRTIRDRYPKVPAVRELVAQYFSEKGDEEDDDEEESATATMLFSGGRPATTNMASLSQPELPVQQPMGTQGSIVLPSVSQIAQLPEMPAGPLPATTFAHQLPPVPAEPTRRNLWPFVAIGAVLLLVAVVIFQTSQNAASKQSYITVSSRPAGAQILVDGQLQGSMTPARLALPATGKAEIRVEMAGYEPFATSVSYNAGESLSLSPELKQEIAYGSIEVISTPPGAAITSDGKPLGAVTPSRLDQLIADRSYKIGLTRDGYQTFSQDVTVKRGQSVLITASLTPVPKAAVSPPPTRQAPGPGTERPPAVTGTGELVVNAVPPDCEIFVDGAKKGTAPVKVKVPAGDHKVSLVRFDGSRKDFTVNVPAGGQVTRVWDFFDQQWISD